MDNFRIVPTSDFERMAEMKSLQGLAGWTRRYSIHEDRPDFFQVHDNRRLLDGLTAWSGLVGEDDEDTLDLLEELSGERSAGPTLNLADQRALYILMLVASLQAYDDKDTAGRLGRLCRGAVVFEGDQGRVAKFLFDLLGLQ